MSVVHSNHAVTSHRFINISKHRHFPYMYSAIASIQNCINLRNWNPHCVMHRVESSCFRLECLLDTALNTASLYRRDFGLIDGWLIRVNQSRLSLLHVSESPSARLCTGRCSVELSGLILFCNRCWYCLWLAEVAYYHWGSYSSSAERTRLLDLCESDFDDYTCRWSLN